MALCSGVFSVWYEECTCESIIKLPNVSFSSSRGITLVFHIGLSGRFSPNYEVHKFTLLLKCVESVVKYCKRAVILRAGTRGSFRADGSGVTGAQSLLSRRVSAGQQC